MRNRMFCLKLKFYKYVEKNYYTNKYFIVLYFIFVIDCRTHAMQL